MAGLAATHTLPHAQILLHNLHQDVCIVHMSYDEDVQVFSQTD